MVQKKYGKNLGLTKQSWFLEFQDLWNCWNSWDEHCHHLRVYISAEDEKEARSSATTYFLPLKGKLGVKTGIHSFFLKILLTSSYLGIGIGDDRISNQQTGYTPANNGIGFYQEGKIYQFNKLVVNSALDFKNGDIVGFTLDMDNKTVTFFRNGEVFFKPLSVVMDSTPNDMELKLYPFILMEGISKVKIIKSFPR